MSVDLDGRMALVTGAASGIGAACARRLAAAGAKVTILDLDREGAERVAAEVGGTPLVVDLARPQRLDGLELDADVLVNNVGLQHVAPVEEFPPERFQRMLAVMLEAPFRLARAVLPGMYRPGWGQVVNVSSVHGLRASPYKSAYVAAKQPARRYAGPQPVDLPAGAPGTRSPRSATPSSAGRTRPMSCWPPLAWAELAATRAG